MTAPGSVGETDAEGIILPTQEPDEAVEGPLFTGQLILEDHCLRVVSDADGISYLIIWPQGFTWEPEGTVAVVRDGAKRVVARAGERIAMGGREAAFVSEDIGCAGPGWYSSEQVWIGNASISPSAMGTYPPKPSDAEMGRFGQNQMLELFDERSGNSNVILARPLDPEEVHRLALDGDLSVTEADPVFCEGLARTATWYCGTQARPFIVIAKGVWWEHGLPPRYMGPYLAVLYDLSDEFPVPILIDSIPSCDGAIFEPLLRETDLPQLEPGQEC